MSLLHDKDSIIKITHETSTLTIIDEDLKLILNWGKFEGKDSIVYELFKKCDVNDVIVPIIAEEDLDVSKNSEISAKVKFHYEVNKSPDNRNSRNFKFKKIKVKNEDSRRLVFSEKKDIHYISFDIEDKSVKGDKPIAKEIFALLKKIHPYLDKINSFLYLDLTLDLDRYEKFLINKNHKRGHTEVIIGGGGGGQKKPDA